MADHQIIKQAKQGDKEAIASLYRQYQGQIYRYIAYRVGDTSVADDLTADVFVSMVKAIGSYQQRGKPFLAWLYTIAGNVVKMHYRARSKQPVEPISEQIIDERASPADLAHNQLTQAKLLAVLPRLSEAQRQVILLKFIEGFSNREIAQLLGKNEGAIRILQHRAIQALRTLLAEVRQPHAV